MVVGRTRLRCRLGIDPVSLGSRCRPREFRHAARQLPSQLRDGRQLTWAMFSLRPQRAKDPGPKSRGQEDYQQAVKGAPGQATCPGPVEARAGSCGALLRGAQEVRAPWAET